MSDNALIFGGDLVDSRNNGGPKPAGYWKVSNSMYVTVLKDAIRIVMKHESFLLTEAETSYLNGLQKLDTDAFYLLARLALRKPRWYRHADYARYAEQLGGDAKLELACRILCNRTGIHRPPQKSPRTLGTVDAPIDLTSDDSEDENLQRSPNFTSNTSTKVEEADLSYHALSHEEAELIDLLQMLKAPELEDLSKQLKLSGKKKKAQEIVKEIVEKSSTQSTLSFRKEPSVGRSKEKQPLRQLNLNFKPKDGSNVLADRVRAICLRLLGSCIRINKGVMAVLRRVNLVFFRTTAYDAHMFVPAILVACKKRKYSAYQATRTNAIFSDRNTLIEYENALNLEQQIGQLLSDHSRAVTVAEKQALENQGIDMYNQVIEQYKIQLGVRNDDRQGLERFEAGYIFVRTLHHMAFFVGKISGGETELDILTNLVLQPRWLLGKRGGWYDRIACIHMKKSKEKGRLEKAYEVVKTALLDTETRLQFRPKLIRRLERLEKSLNIPLDDRHQSRAYLTEWKEIYILGERINLAETEPQNQTLLQWGDSPLIPPTLPARRGSGRTAWKSAAGSPISVESFALEHYAEKGYKGKHCEGKTVRFLFALLFHDILFHTLPGAFETEYQTAPLDLVLDTFYSSRKGMIDQRLSEILGGNALDIASKADAKHRPHKTFFVGAQWDIFSTEEILEIIECLPSRVLHAICEQQAFDYAGTGGGVPDLIIWKPNEAKACFVEVKSPSDRLSETQKLWLHVLETADEALEGMVEVCHVETLGDRQSRLEKGRRRNTPKAISKKKTLKKRPADEEPETAAKRRKQERPVSTGADGKL